MTTDIAHSKLDDPAPTAPWHAKPCVELTGAESVLRPGKTRDDTLAQSAAYVTTRSWTYSAADKGT